MSTLSMADEAIASAVAARPPARFLLLDHPADSDELRRYQVFSAGLLVAENSTPRGILESLRWMDLYNVDPGNLSMFIQRTHAVTPEDIRRVAATYFDPARMMVVVVGDRAVVAPQLVGIGRVIE